MPRTLNLVIVTALIVPAIWLTGTIVLSHDPYIHPGRCHSAIKDIYLKSKLEYDSARAPALINLREACSPPRPASIADSPCWCMLLKDASGDVERDVSGIGYGNFGWAWNFPKSKSLRERGIYRVNVRRIEPSMYSVIACGYDGR